MALTPDVLVRGLGVTLPVATNWLRPIQETLDAYDISTPKRQAAFLAQVGHESGLFTELEENLNYSAAGLLSTWPRRFTGV